VTSSPREKPQENVKRKKNHESNPCTFPTKKQIAKKLRIIVLRLRIRIGVRDNRCRHVRRSGLVQSLKSEIVMQVCCRKARCPENLLRLDTAAFKEVTKEGRDVSGLGSSEVLVALDVLHVHALQVGSLWRRKQKDSVLTSLGVCQSSSVLGAKLAAVRTFFGLVARVAIMCIHVHPGIFSRMKVRSATRT
jgi:hypothetical protein